MSISLRRRILQFLFARLRVISSKAIKWSSNAICRRRSNYIAAYMAWPVERRCEWCNGRRAYKSEGQSDVRTDTSRQTSREIVNGIDPLQCPSNQPQLCTQRQPVATTQLSIGSRKPTPLGSCGLWLLRRTGCVPPCYRAVNKIAATLPPALVTFT